MSVITPQLPDPPSVEQIRRDMENVRQQNDRLSQDQVNMIVGAEKIKGDIEKINLQLLGIWGLLATLIGGAVLLAWTVYTRLDDKIDKNQTAYLEQYEKMTEKIDNTTGKLDSSIDIMKAVSEEIKNQKRIETNSGDSLEKDQPESN